MRLRALIPLLSWLWASTAAAVIVSAGDGTGNTAPPDDDPGFANVGAQAGATAVYLGAGWVITANHVGTGDPVFGGISYHVVPGSTVQLHNSDSSLADVRVFRVNPFPPLPPLLVYPSVPAVNTNVVMIGRGRDRGAATTWSGHSGWLYASTASMRWGTNRVSARNLLVLSTRAFRMDFTQTGGTTSEAQAALGDSGGAVFLSSGGTWYLAGILFAEGPYANQPVSTAFFGNLSYAAQLSEYAAQVSTLVGQSVCDDGLDNDGDGYVDYPADIGCRDASYAAEDPACNNGTDDDGDGLTDLADPQCTGQPWYPFESATQACGLGFELAPLLPLLAWLRGRRKRALRA